MPDVPYTPGSGTTTTKKPSQNTPYSQPQPPLDIPGYERATNDWSSQIGQMLSTWRSNQQQMIADYRKALESYQQGQGERPSLNLDTQSLAQQLLSAFQNGGRIPMPNLPTSLGANIQTPWIGPGAPPPSTAPPAAPTLPGGMSISPPGTPGGIHNVSMAQGGYRPPPAPNPMAAPPVPTAPTIPMPGYGGPMQGSPMAPAPMGAPSAASLFNQYLSRRRGF